MNTANLFDNILFNAIESHRIKLIHDLLRDNIDLSNASVLDLGSGSGHLALSFEEITKDNYVGIDGSKKQVESANARGLRVIHHDLSRRIPLEDNRYDIVFALEIIEHLFETENFLEDIFRVLGANGILILSTPNITGLGCRIRCLFGKRPPVIECRGRGNVSGHIRAFDKSDIYQLVCEAGFKEIKIIGREFLFPAFFKPIFSYNPVKRLNYWLCKTFPQLNAGFLVFGRKPKL